MTSKHQLAPPPPDWFESTRCVCGLTRREHRRAGEHEAHAFTPVRAVSVAVVVSTGDGDEFGRSG